MCNKRKTLTGSPDPTHANGTDKPCTNRCFPSPEWKSYSLGHYSGVVLHSFPWYRLLALGIIKNVCLCSSSKQKEKEAAMWSEVHPPTVIICRNNGIVYLVICRWVGKEWRSVISTTASLKCFSLDKYTNSTKAFSIVTSVVLTGTWPITAEDTLLKKTKIVIFVDACFG